MVGETEAATQRVKYKQPVGEQTGLSGRPEEGKRGRVAPAFLAE